MLTQVVKAKPSEQANINQPEQTIDHSRHTAVARYPTVGLLYVMEKTLIRDTKRMPVCAAG
jgi:hypothetical protein